MKCRASYRNPRSRLSELSEEVEVLRKGVAASQDGSEEDYSEIPAVSLKREDFREAKSLRRKLPVTLLIVADVSN